MKFDLHVHSMYSKDSFLKPETILKVARKRGLDGVAVTDHNTIKGGLATQKINDNKDFTVIVGSEIKTEFGDIIGLFLQEEIISRNFNEVVEEIKNQGGLTILAHPFRKGITFPSNFMNKIDLIEAFNARSTRKLNNNAHEFAKKFNKPITSGSDAHLGFEIGGGGIICQSDIKNELIRGNTEVEGRESNYYLVHGLSVAMENVKKIR